MTWIFRNRLKSGSNHPNRSSFLFQNRKMGQEISDDEKFTKPKHKVIADAYAKRLEDVISISIQNSHIDPAGLNFDMNNLNSTETYGMETTLTNYLYNIINRRNAVPHIDFHEAKNCAPCTNSCASSCDSEISVSVLQRCYNLSVESRRSSIDSQLSLKLAETEIKATVESRSQKHKSVKVKGKKRQRNCYAAARRSSRRTSSSSVENKIVETTRRGRIERRSACTKFNINDIKQSGRNALKSNHTSVTTSEDEDFLKKSKRIQCKVPGSKAKSDSDNNLDLLAKHSVNSVFYPFLQEFVQRNKSAIKSNFDYSDDHLAIKSKENNKNKLSRPSNGKCQEADVITTSLSSSIELGIPLAATQSSYSGISNNGNKTHSRNSKASCDVAVQANAYDIASQVKKIDETDANYTNEDDLETHQLLPYKKREPTVFRKNNVAMGLSKSEQVRMLLLPDTNTKNCF